MAQPGNSETEPRRVIVRGGATGLAQTVEVGAHRWISDEPVGLGGEDAGPTPYDLVLAGLGACTSMTIAMYARRKGWPLAGVTVTLAHSRIHAQDCADCETKVGRLDEIERAIALDGITDPEQRARLLEIAEKCPVHRTLSSEIAIRTRLV